MSSPTTVRERFEEQFGTFKTAGRQAFTQRHVLAFIESELSAQEVRAREEIVIELLREVSSLETKNYLWQIIAERTYMSQSRSGPIAQARRDGFDIGKGYLVDVLNRRLLSSNQKRP